MEDLERDIAQTVEAQVRENGVLAERVRGLEEGVRGCLPSGGAGEVVEGLRDHIEQMRSVIA